jgi:hypothetical protein
MSQITAPFDAIASALTTAQQAVTDATSTLTNAQSTLTTDQQTGQTAADTLVSAISAAGFSINTPAPNNPTPPAPSGN